MSDGRQRNAAVAEASRHLSKWRWLRPCVWSRWAGNRAAKLPSDRSRSAGGAAAGCAAALGQKKQRVAGFFGFHGSARKFILRTSPGVTGKLPAKFMRNPHKVMHSQSRGSGSRDMYAVNVARPSFSVSTDRPVCLSAGLQCRQRQRVHSLKRTGRS